jgi:hypothetical protein
MTTKTDQKPSLLILLSSEEKISMFASALIIKIVCIVYKNGSLMTTPWVAE